MFVRKSLFCLILSFLVVCICMVIRIDMLHKFSAELRVTYKRFIAKHLVFLLI